MPDILKLKWRLGRQIGTNIYAMISDEPSDGDIYLGCLDPYNYELASHIVTLHNNELV